MSQTLASGPGRLQQSAAGGTSSNFGAAFPPAGTAAGFKDTNGNMAGGNLDAGGNLLVAGSLAVTPTHSNTSSAPAQTAVGTGAAQVLAANANRKGWKIQNTGTSVIKITLGATNPTQTAFHFSLPACGNANDGSSPVYEDYTWTGQVNAISSVGGGTVVVTELT